MSNLLLGGPAIASTGGFWLGIAIGLTIVVVVVVLVMTIITLASKIAGQATAGSRGMLDAYANTNAVWRLRDVNRSTTGIWRAAQSARKVLEGR
jgi:glycerol-3-phosphate acyltransferase PlsY